MSDDLVKRLRDASTEALQAAWRRTDGGQDLVLGATLAEQAADRIEELEAENKLLSEGATIAHLRGAMDAHANRADDIWEAHKHWEGEKKFALREVVKYLRGGKDE